MEKAVLDAISKEEISDAINAFEKARLEGKRIFICGNGGSAATASHLECDFNTLQL